VFYGCAVRVGPTETLAAIGRPDLRVVSTLPPNWHGDAHWLVEDPVSGTRFSLRATAIGREIRWEESRRQSIETVRAQLDAGAAFARAKIPFMARIGGPVLLAGHVVVMFAWGDGEIAWRATERRARAVGKLLRRVHEARVPVDEQLPVHDVVAMAERSTAELAHVCDVSFAHDAIDAARSDAPRIVVHGDVNFPNVLWHGDEVTGLVDFDQIGRSRAVEELAWLVKWWARAQGMRDHAPDPGLARAVLDGYGGVDDMAGLRAMLWITGCLNANSVRQVARNGPSAFDALRGRADRLARLV
jgi:aminoglycoside phosphotransferase (APT) family kinase protein